jgi:hypothetical protein
LSIDLKMGRTHRLEIEVRRGWGYLRIGARAWLLERWDGRWVMTRGTN